MRADSLETEAVDGTGVDQSHHLVKTPLDQENNQPQLEIQDKTEILFL